MHEAEVAVAVLLGHRQVFVEVKRNDPAEVQPLVLVQPDEFAVKGHRGAAGGQTQHGGLAGGVAGTDEFVDLAGQMLGRRGTAGKQRGRHAGMR